MAEQATEGKKVKIHYTGKLEDGSVFDTSEGKEPIEFVIGEGKVIPGFENAVKGMTIGEEKDITIKKEDGYGERREELVQKVPKEQTKEMDVQVGMMIGMQVPGQEQVFPAKIVEIGESDITVDLNPPLAGQDLKFHIKLESME